MNFEEISNRRERHIRRLQQEIMLINSIDIDEYKKQFCDHPEEKVLVIPFDGAHVPEALFEASAYDEKLVLLKLVVNIGRTSLVIVDECGGTIEPILTFTNHGMTVRHFAIDKSLGLALSRDGSLRGVLAETPNHQVAE